MKRFILMGLLLAMASGPLASAADGPDDQYVRIYNLLQQADELNRVGQKREAYEKYLAVQTGLKTLGTAFPEFNQRIVQFRLNYVADKLTLFGPPPAPLAAPVGTTAASDQTAVEKPDKTPLATEGQEALKIKALTDEVQRLGTEKAMLEAKLREALSAQPATVEPREVAKAEERIRGLLKENELLKLSLEQEKTKLGKTPAAAEVESIKKSLATATRTLDEQTKTIAALKQEKELLETRLRGAASQPAPIVSTPAPLVSSPAPTVETGALRKQIEDLQSQLKLARKTTAAETTAEAKAARAEAKQIKRLQEERDDLTRKLASAEQALKKKESRASKKEPAAIPAAADPLKREIQALQARLEVLEARKVPYTAEELALFKAPEPTLAAPAVAAPASAAPAVATGKPAPVKKPVVSREDPAGAAPLVAEARKAYSAGHFDEAERNYQRVLLLDENNINALGNIAVTQLQQKRLDEAEKNLKKALELDPEDTFNLNLMGQLKFQQNKLDEALDILTKAARLDPRNPETQNNLGITLSQKGLREPAETALRKAIQLAPDYADAHHNLAVVYAFQNPPYMELARYHYRTALAGGHLPNAELDKLLGKK